MPDKEVLTQEATDTKDVFTHTDPELLPILEELRRREPIFHTPRFAVTLDDVERGVAPEFWEVGASGRRYSRSFILHMLATDPARYVNAEEAGWTADGFAVRRLGPGTYLLTYLLNQAGRRTRRVTIWEKTADNWRILYHQGTPILLEGDDTLA
ncbi:MAG: DUF4440 domain-containing protein [Terracidiphilus sp.]|nr:DUF4440 domain-containing protein [Terracidiphilus sp.]